jgi:hypothetical protein
MVSAMVIHTLSLIVKFCVSISLQHSSTLDSRATPRHESCVKEYCIRRWVMISKCANPNCSKLLMRLDGGRFYGFPTQSKKIEHFWLCSTCSKSFVLRQVEGRVELLHRDRRIA